MFVRWKKAGCRYFLYENNYSIHKDIKAEISRQLGVEPIMINSALVFSTKPKTLLLDSNVTQSDDKGILLKDIIESGMAWQGKTYCLSQITAVHIWKYSWTSLHIFQQLCRHVQAPPYRRKYRQINLILSLFVLSAEGTISMKFSSLQSSLLQILSIFSNLRKAQLLLHISQIVERSDACNSDQFRLRLHVL